MRLAHLGVAPENIYVSPTGEWKLGGFVFSTQIINPTLTEVKNLDYQTKDSDQYIRMHPNLNYSSPEVVANPPKCLHGSDIFSFGLVLLTIYKCRFDGNTASASLLEVVNRMDHAQKVKDFTYVFQSSRFFQSLDGSLRELVQQCLAENQAARPSIDTLEASQYLNDPFVRALKHLEKITDLEQGQQQNFLRGLQQIFFKYDHSLLKSRLIPLMMELVKFNHLIAQVLEYIILIVKQEGFMTIAEFEERVKPSLRLIIKGKEIPAQALYLIIQNIHLFFKFVDKETFQSDFIPLILKCYECKVQKIQALVLSQTEFLIQKLDYTQSKNQLLPRILSLSQNASMDLRKPAVQVLAKIFPAIDVLTLNDQVEPPLQT